LTYSNDAPIKFYGLTLVVIAPWLANVSDDRSSLDLGGAGFFLGACPEVVSFSSLYPALLTEPFSLHYSLFFFGSISLIVVSSCCYYYQITFFKIIC
jgi:hypothetical protein